MSVKKPEIKIVLLRKESKMPTKGSAEAAYWDLYPAGIPEIVVSKKSKDESIQQDALYIMYKLGITSEITPGWYAEIVARSSISKTDLILANGKGVIDSDYRGEWQARFKVVLPPFYGILDILYSITGISKILKWKNNLLNNTVDALYKTIKFFKEGDAICQFRLVKVEDFTITQVDKKEELSKTERGEGGFGSTNKEIVENENITE